MRLKDSSRLRARLKGTNEWKATTEQSIKQQRRNYKITALISSPPPSPFLLSPPNRILLPRLSSCPPALEGHGPLTSHNSAASAFTAGLLVELHLNTSTPDTFRPPPAPLPYDVVLGCPQSPDSESVQETISHSSFGTLATCEDLYELDCKTQPGSLLVSPRKSEVTKLHETVASVTEEEDACPICLEEYDLENPKHMTNCEHHFHLSCILEWMERSDTCPICDQEVIFDHNFN